MRLIIIFSVVLVGCGDPDHWSPGNLLVGGKAEDRGSSKKLLPDGAVAVVTGRTSNPTTFGFHIGTVWRGEGIGPGYHISAGKHKGVVFVYPLFERGEYLQVKAIVPCDTCPIKLELWDHDACDGPYPVRTTSDIPREYFTKPKRGFDLDGDNVDNSGAALSEELSQMLYDFMLGQGEYFSQLVGAASVTRVGIRDFQITFPERDDSVVEAKIQTNGTYENEFVTGLALRFVSTPIGCHSTFDVQPYRLLQGEKNDFLEMEIGGAPRQLSVEVSQVLYDLLMRQGAFYGHDAIKNLHRSTFP